MHFQAKFQDFMLLWFELNLVGNGDDRFHRDKAHFCIYEPRREKTKVLVSDLVRHKPGCTGTEDD